LAAALRHAQGQGLNSLALANRELMQARAFNLQNWTTGNSKGAPDGAEARVSNADPCAFAHRREELAGCRRGDAVR
jgi:hypothetical protein